MEIGYSGKDHNEDDEKHGEGLENFDHELWQPRKLELNEGADDQGHQQPDSNSGDFAVRNTQIGILEYHVAQRQHPQRNHG